MVALAISLHGDGCWPDLLEKPYEEAEHLGMALLQGGMESGKASVTIRMDTEDGRVFLAETSLALFLQAARMFAAKEGIEL